MKTIKDIEIIIIKNRKELEEKFGLKEIGIFGSYARGDQLQDSDIDILVEIERPMGFIKFIKLENHLSQILGVNVDLVTRKALKPYIGKRILQEVQYV
ncbi:MAG: nucleotidyltransferase family protein [Deltaproteobacteria bacterium]|nr:nucleotidyltransferase family protein [Deltaproteobacteria bacterium]